MSAPTASAVESARALVAEIEGELATEREHLAAAEAALTEWQSKLNETECTREDAVFEARVMKVAAKTAKRDAFAAAVLRIEARLRTARGDLEAAEREEAAERAIEEARAVTEAATALRELCADFEQRIRHAHATLYAAGNRWLEAKIAAGQYNGGTAHPLVTRFATDPEHPEMGARLLKIARDTAADELRQERERAQFERERKERESFEKARALIGPRLGSEHPAAWEGRVRDAAEQIKAGEEPSALDFPPTFAAVPAWAFRDHANAEIARKDQHGSAAADYDPLG